MSAELEHAEQVMLAHEKEHFSDKHKHHKDKEHSDISENYKSLYSSFDELKPHEDLPPSLHKVFDVMCKCHPKYECIKYIT